MRTIVNVSTNPGLLVLGCGLALALGCKAEAGENGDDGDADAPARTLSLPVVGQTVRQGDLVLSVTTTGQVRSESEATLKAEAAGTVQEVLVRPGRRVAAGQALVQLDPRPFDLALEEAEAALEEAQLRYLDNLLPDSIVSGQAPTAERRQNAETRSGLKAARARHERAKLDRERATIRAPFGGVVDRVEVSAGERIGANQDVASVVDMTHLRLEASVLEHDLALIKRGGQAVITTAAAPGKPVTGRIAAILPVVDSATRAGRAMVQMRGDGTLRPGMYADVRLEATRLADRILVPARAVIERDGRPLVFVVKDGRAQWVYISPGRTNGIETEVEPDSVSGQIPVAVGDTVLIEGHLTLTHDAPVRLEAIAERPAGP
ncbi:MAG: efflux RND transporter periplasmic adaptor subunit [Gemmatimonadales bacterium]|nr:efflux RND transporter periplasmic adaptor subunit [Gemmatimonadales bacterium]